MEDIRTLYDDFLKLPFPRKLHGEEIDDIDLVLLDSDTAGLIQKSIANHSKLPEGDFEILRQCFYVLESVIKQLEGNEREYFVALRSIASHLIDSATNNSQTQEN